MQAHKLSVEPNLPIASEHPGGNKQSPGNQGCFSRAAGGGGGQNEKGRHPVLAGTHST